ncbi:hypothetical protein QCA50_002002 [Cerrena zonata]|uniref:Zn(2)-C6 fungal-type domain-containing protein n=1 Tax=Cerrena zonata TaxID=2478898 RepID=A0AAW0GSM4_9APHY
MPKATSGSSSRPALRRNQACLSCRKRKLKCDAARPHCGTCVKQWQAVISVPPPVGYAHPTEPQCSYDPVEGLPIAPDVDPADKIRMLEDQISQLKTQLNESRTFNSRSESPSRYYIPSHARVGSALSNSPGKSPAASPNGNGIVLPQASLDMGTKQFSTSSPESLYRGSTGSPELRQPAGASGGEMLFSGWDPDLPNPDVLNHYIDVFFRCDPCGSRVLHRPAFLASLSLHPKDANFPHSAVLHAICASASRWSSHDIVTSPDGSRRDRFAEFHVSKTRTYIDRTMATGQDIFPVMQACILLSWGPNSPGAYLAPPKDFKELEGRRRTWWMTIMFDRIVSVGGWLHGVDERDIGTELPLRCVDFENDTNITSNPQDLASPDLFTRHPLAYTDSFLLYLKAVMLFGRVTDHNTRSNLRANISPIKVSNPYTVPGFEELDELVNGGFINSFPPEFKHLGVMDDGSLDTDLYMAHLVPHAATITLHNAYVNFSDPQNVSTLRCVNATRSILAAYYKLSETSLDITRLHPFVTICWYLAAVVQIQLCKYFIEINDTSRESTVWGEINLLRWAMLSYGSRSPIGTRQEKLLQGLMTEIVRMTSQMQPLEVGVPLYPFSHTTLFSKDGSGAVQQDPIDTPLPDGRHFDEEGSVTSPNSIGGLSGGTMGPSSMSSSLSHQSHSSASASMLAGWASGKDVRMPNSGISPSALYGHARPTYPH